MLSQVNTIVYCTDLGRYTRPAFRLAVSIAQQFDARVIFLHVIEPLREDTRHLVEMYLPEESVLKVRKQGAEAVRQRVLERIQKFCAEEMADEGEFPRGGPEPRVVEGEAASAVLKVAEEEGADLIVMGSHTHSMMGELMLGSVAHKVTHHSTRPVLLVPLKE